MPRFPDSFRQGAHEGFFDFLPLQAMGMNLIVFAGGAITPLNPKLAAAIVAPFVAGMAVLLGLGRWLQ